MGVHERIMKLENGYETNLGEGGMNISHSVKELICLARGALVNNKIILLDDVTRNINDEKTPEVVEKLLIS